MSQNMFEDDSFLNWVDYPDGTSRLKKQACLGFIIREMYLLHWEIIEGGAGLYHYYSDAPFVLLELIAGKTPEREGFQSAIFECVQHYAEEYKEDQLDSEYMGKILSLHSFKAFYAEVLEEWRAELNAGDVPVSYLEESHPGYSFDLLEYVREARLKEAK